MDRLLTLRGPLAAALIAAGMFAAFPAAAGDPGHGKAVFGAQCAMCHSNARGGPTILGPTLFGVVGRPAGAVKGFAYSSALRSSGLTWGNDKLRAYVAAPAKTLPGVRMTYGGLHNPAQLEDLIAYLDTLK
ncbi:MAG: c-type cytochrome [Caulobacterales bacterium]